MICASKSASPAVLCLGRLGDVTTALPIAHEVYYQTGGKTPFIVSREYADILDGCSYIEPVIFDGEFHRLNRAIGQFSHRYGTLHIAQVYASDGPMPPTETKSFVTDAWKRAGMLDKFGLPLVFDRRSPERETALIERYAATTLDRGPFIVLHRGGVSSPYPYRAELMAALKGLPIFDITGLQCAKPYDLLAILERASCAILADSFPLHLSFACPDLPVIALQTDKPTDWFGAPPRPNWTAQYRYAESLNRMTDIAELAKSTLPTSSTKSTFRFPEGAYNASVLNHGKATLHTFRYHPNNSWQTRLNGSLKGITSEIEIPQDQTLSQEDARLFNYNGKPHISFTLAKMDGKKPRCVIGYGELVLARHGMRVKNPLFVRYGRNDWSGLEKNWVFFEQGKKLYCLYASQPEQIVLEIEGDKVVAGHRSPAPTWPYGDMRGDVILPYNGKLLRVFHSCTRYPSRKFRYHIGVSLLEPTAPFRTIAVCQAPLFSGDESRPKTRHHSKQNVVFTCGAMIEGDELVIPVSSNDDSTTIRRVNLKRIQL